MNARTRSRIPALAVLICLLALSVMAAAPPRAAADDWIAIRFEGYIKATGPSKWLIGNSFVLVDSQTVIIEKFGRAEVGAWVVVWGRENPQGAIYGEIIQVERPAGSAPIWQFSGVVTKRFVSQDRWVVNGLLVQQTGETQIIGTPDTGWLVWVVAEYQEATLRALVIMALAPDPGSVPAEFQGTLEAVGPEGGQIDGHPYVLGPDSFIIGTPAAGLQAELRGVQDESGVLHVDLLRALDATARLSQRGPASGPYAAAPYTADNATTTPRATPEVVADGLSDAARPTLVEARDGTMHAVWASDGNVMWATRPPDGTWSQGRRIASGSEPVLVSDSTGVLHVIFTKQFMGNYEIYHVIYQAGAGTWTLPVNVSHTSGVSQKPAAAAGPDGKLYATWMDDTPNYWTIYSAQFISDGFWSCQPIPYGRGQSPAMTVAPDGTLLVAWQDTVPTVDNPTGFMNIFWSEQEEGGWSLPINISDRDDLNAEQVSITTTAEALVHLVWIEDGRAIRYVYGQHRSWPLPNTIASADVLARGPRIAAENGVLLHVAWDETTALRTTSAPGASLVWPEPETVATLEGTLNDVGLNVTRDNKVTMSWVEVPQSGAASIYASRCERQLPRRNWLPLLTRGQ